MFLLKCKDQQALRLLQKQTSYKISFFVFFYFYVYLFIFTARTKTNNRKTTKANTSVLVKRRRIFGKGAKQWIKADIRI